MRSSTRFARPSPATKERRIAACLVFEEETPQGKVRLAFPLHALRFHFTALWPEAEADAEGH